MKPRSKRARPNQAIWDAVFGRTTTLPKLTDIQMKLADSLSIKLNGHDGLHDLINKLTVAGTGVDVDAKKLEQLDNRSRLLTSRMVFNPYLMIPYGIVSSYGDLDKALLAVDPAWKSHIGRILSAMWFVLNKSYWMEGHMWMPVKSTVAKARDLAKVKIGVMYDALTSADDSLMHQHYLEMISDQNAIGLRNMLMIESGILDRINQLAGTPLDEIPFIDNPELTPLQRQALKIALTSRVSILTGMAGTGKTFVTRQLIHCLTAARLRFNLCAPTGKAARRMTEVTGVEAQTIHRMLGLVKTDDSGDSTAPIREEFRMADYLIVDEVSMMDSLLMSTLMLNINEKRTRILFLGDENQLLPVGPGGALRDLCNNPPIPVTTLTEVKRQAGTLRINAAKVLDGELVREKTDDWRVYTLEQDVTAEKIRKFIVKNLVPMGYDLVQDIQILVPTHKGPCGTISINKAIREIAIPDETQRKLPYAVGDKVIQTSNDYNINIMNGTIGVVTRVNYAEGNKHGMMWVKFEGTSSPIPIEIESGERTNNSQPYAYAITVHKSQGSEFPCVITIMDGSWISNFMVKKMSQNLTYTAVTRARKLNIVIASSKITEDAVAKRASDDRNTFLSLLLERGYGKPKDDDSSESTGAAIDNDEDEEDFDE